MTYRCTVAGLNPNFGELKYMSRIFSLLFFLALPIVFSGSLLAQDCTEAALAQKPGVLKASKLVSSTYGVKAADLVREKSTLMSVHKMVAAAYNPVGIVGEYRFHFSGRTDVQNQSNIADTFGYSMYLKKYNCDKGKPDRKSVV